MDARSPRASRPSARRSLPEEARSPGPRRARRDLYTLIISLNATGLLPGRIPPAGSFPRAAGAIRASRKGCARSGGQAVSTGLRLARPVRPRFERCPAGLVRALRKETQARGERGIDCDGRTGARWRPPCPCAALAPDSAGP
jgi:hypothetical protein